MSKGPTSYDPEVVKEFIDRLFTIEREMKVLSEDRKELKQEFKDKINHKVLGKVIRLVKAKVAVETEEVSPDTVEEIETFVRDKVSMVLE